MTREEAINEIKSWVIPSKKGREVLETLIPELKESEDERIREDLIGGLMWQRDNLETNGPHDNSNILPGFCFSVGEHFAYLEKQKEEEGYEAIPVESTLEYKLGFKAGKESEKQKEQKPIECIEFANEFEKQVSHLLASVLNGEWEYNKGFVKHAAQSLLGFAKHELKSAEIHIDDPNIQKIDPNVIVETRTDGTGELNGKALLYTADKSYQIGFRDGAASVKPAEWSEEDKGILMDAICATEKLGDNEIYNKNNPNLAKAFRVAKDWLKFLPERFNLQPKQEWSEKDEEHINSIFNDFKQGVIPDEEDQEWLKNRLKSIRPSWKPSEEQMDAFEDAMTYIPEFYKPKSNLASLLRDLKKLM